jgi:hypothetical protein
MDVFLLRFFQRAGLALSACADVPHENKLMLGEKG